MFIYKIIKPAIRTSFNLTSRQKATDGARKMCDKYLSLAGRFTEETGKKSVRVPVMPGVDPDMRDWSFFMLLEHNAIVNQCITAMTCQLSKNEPLHGLAAIDPKKDVMPSASPGIEQVEAFEASVKAHIEAVSGLGRLRGGATSQHPNFGMFDAHKWHCMFAFHLKVHLKQAALIASGANPS